MENSGISGRSWKQKFVEILREEDIEDIAKILWVEVETISWKQLALLHR